MALTFTPHSIVYLCNVPMSADQKNQIDFSSVGAQSAYFQGRVIRSFTDFTYQRKDNVIRVPVEADAIWNCNYVMYQNANFTGKWFYAFVTEIEYRNDGCTWLHIKTDVFQTWLFNYTWRSSFIVREHVADDTIGLHTIPENIPTGEPKIEDYTTLQSGFETSLGRYDINYWTVIICSEVPQQWGLAPPSTMAASGIPNCAYFIGTDSQGLPYLVDTFNQEGIAAAIVNIVSAPRNQVAAAQIPGTNFYAISAADTGMTVPVDITCNLTDIDGYTPKNNKCFCYPYHYALMSNHCGQEIKLMYEFMSAHQMRTKYILSSAPTFYAFPAGYSAAPAEDLAVSFSNYPQIAWNYDAFKNWLALNGNTLATGLISDFASTAISVGTGNVTGLVGTTLSITNEIGQMVDRMHQPKQLKGSVSGSANMSCDSACVTVYEMCCRAEYIKIVDQYFQRYGYRVNAVRVPNLQSRPKWNYIETRDCCLDVDAPENDAQELENIFNSGVTIWHDASAYGNYTLDNSP